MAYTDHVRAGSGLPSVWGELKNALYLGDEDFGTGLQTQLQGELAHTEIFPAQRCDGAGPCRRVLQPERYCAGFRGALRHGQPR